MVYDRDFKAIAALPISEMAQKLGWTLTPKESKKGPQLVGNCPITGGGDSTVFKVTPAINRWICFCPQCRALPKSGGDIIELMRRLKGIEPKNVRTAALEVQKLFSGAAKADEPASSEPEPTRKVEEFTQERALAYLQALETEHYALQDLDILPETLIEFKAGFSGKGRHRGRLAVAWCDMDGKIKGFISVSINGDLPRYLSPKEGAPLPYWWGCNRLEDGCEFRILRTLLDVLRASENGEENCIAPLRPINADAITCLYALMKDKSLILEV